MNSEFFKLFTLFPYKVRSSKESPVQYEPKAEAVKRSRAKLNTEDGEVEEGGKKKVVWIEFYCDVICVSCELLEIPICQCQLESIKRKVVDVDLYKKYQETKRGERKIAYSKKWRRASTTG
ncbi:unnamed protein product [Orchesella dallaii]|uniref:Uncharacterized protein n=1 Tax=Orchesella dallaii TaxID=48710 RepID=A0ABP1RJ96_9HEXA